VFLKRVVVAGLLWGCLFSAARPSPCVLALNSQLPLRSTTGHKLVDALIDEQPATLIFDTGAYSSLLTTQAVSRLHLHADQDFSERFRGPEDPWTVSGIGGARLATWVMAKHVQVGALSGRHFHFLTIDGKMHDGLLGNDILKGYDVDLDFPGKEIRLYKTYGDCAAPKVFLTPPLYVVPLILANDTSVMSPLVKVTVDGHDLVALIDTGASSSALYQRGAAKIGLAPKDLAADRHGTTTGVGPQEVPVSSHIFASVTVGDLTLRHMPIDIMQADDEPPVDMLLGADFQQRIHLWISYSSQKLVMQFPPSASPAAPGGAP